jgi:glutamate-1-semialdehyde 2,1-aminomutase
MGYGAISIGHGELEVVKAVTAQATQGTLLPGRTRGEDKARESLHALFPHTAAASLHKTGSEAVAAAIRIARTATGRMSVVRCGFHGWHDEMIQSNRRWHNSQGPESIMPSVVPGVRDGLAPLEWLDGESASLATILARNRGQVAAVIIDPVQIRNRIAETLSEIVEVCKRLDVLLILDELKTCPRVAMGGVQEAYGVKADLTIVGKGLANGFPFSAVLGPEWMNSVRRESRIMGTFNGELSSLAALSATVEILRRENTPRQLAELGNQFVSQANQLLGERNLRDIARIIGEPWPCMPRICVTPMGDLEARLASEVAKHGACVLCPHMSFICLRHTLEQLNRSAAAVVTAVNELWGR